MTKVIIEAICEFIKRTGRSPDGVIFHPKTLLEFREEYALDTIVGIPIVEDKECHIDRIYVGNLTIERSEAVL